VRRRRADETLAGAGSEFVAAAAAVAPSTVTAAIAPTLALRSRASRAAPRADRSSRGLERTTTTIALIASASPAGSVRCGGATALWIASATKP